MERLGAVERCGGPPWTEWVYFRCTEAGKAAAMESHADIRQPKPARVYRVFLHIRDAWPDLTFKEFLTNDELKDVRAQA